MRFPCSEIDQPDVYIKRCLIQKTGFAHKHLSCSSYPRDAFGMPSYTPTSSLPSASTAQPRLLDRVRDRIRRKGYSLRTEKSYVQWIKRYIFFNGKRHPTEVGKADVEAFLTNLAVEGNVAAATQNRHFRRFCFSTGKFLKRSFHGSMLSFRSPRPEGARDDGDILRLGRFLIGWKGPLPLW